MTFSCIAPKRALALLLLAVTSASATDKIWTGATNTTWGTSTNWTLGNPTSGDNAVFNSVFLNQPNLGATATAGGIWMTGAVGQNVTISGSTLTLQGNTINGTAGLGILVDNATAFTLTITAPLKVGAAQTWTNSSGNLLTIGAGGLNINNKSLIINGSGNTTISGVVSGGGSTDLTKGGSGTLILSGANTYSGLTTVSAGVLNIQNATSLGATTGGSGTTVSSGAALQIQGGIAVGAEALTLNGGGIASNGALRNISGANSFAGAITLGSASTIYSDAGTLTLSGAIANGGFAATFDGPGNITANGLISGTGSLVKNGSGTLILAASNTFSGGATLNGGTTIVYGGSLGASSAAATINAATLEVAATVSSSRNITLGDAASTVMVDPTFTLTSTGVFSGTGALNKTGSGTLALSGANTYSGGTTVSGGTLLVNNTTGSGTGTGNATVNGSGTTLGGTGTISGTVTLGNTTAGAVINPGPQGTDGTSASVGTLTVGALTLSTNSSTFHEDAFNTAQANWDQLKVTGTAALGSAAQFQLSIATSGLNFISGTTYVVIDANSITGAFANAAEGALVTSNGYNFTAHYDTTNGNFDLVAIPEPSTWLAAVLTLGTIGFAQRKRMRACASFAIKKHF